MATRRPRVPKTPQRDRDLVEVGSQARSGGAGSVTPLVSRHSSKVIPLDAGPRTSAAPSGQPSGQPAGRSAGSTADEAAEGAPALEAPDDAAHETEPAPAPQSPAERRAAQRRALLERSRDSAGRVLGRPATGARKPPRPARGAGAATRSRPATPVEPVPARNFTGRSIALLVVLFVAAVLLAPTLRVFLDQQVELRAVQEDIARQQEERSDLQREIERWDDPAYIQQQARERFNLVMPGEQTYMVIGGEETLEDPVPAPASPGEVNEDMPWVDALWDSVVRAGTD